MQASHQVYCMYRFIFFVYRFNCSGEEKLPAELSLCVSDTHTAVDLVHGGVYIAGDDRLKKTSVASLFASASVAITLG